MRAEGKGLVIPFGKSSELRMERAPQLDLFDGLLPTDKGHPYTNSFALYDLAPKHVWAVTEADWRNKEDGVLNIKTRFFEHEGAEYELVITPARFKDETGNQVEAFPGKQEQVLEEALRRLAVARRRTTMINSEPGVKFSFYELRAELKSIGSTMSLQEIKRSIEICHKCSVGLRRRGEKSSPDISAPIFPARALAKQLEDGDTVSYVTFHPLVGAAIMRLEYRLLNYEVQVRFRSHVAKWLHKRLSHRYTQASISGEGYNILASTIVRDSGMTIYKQWRDNLRRVREAVEELKETGVLMFYESEDIKESGGRIADIRFNLHPSLDFVSEVKKANWHQNRVEEEAGKLGLPHGRKPPRK